MKPKSPGSGAVEAPPPTEKQKDIELTFLFTPHGPEDAKDAWSRIEELKPDLILLELSAPKEIRDFFEQKTRDVYEIHKRGEQDPHDPEFLQLKANIERAESSLQASKQAEQIAWSDYIGTKAMINGIRIIPIDIFPEEHPALVEECEEVKSLANEVRNLVADGKALEALRIYPQYYQLLLDTTIAREKIIPMQVKKVIEELDEDVQHIVVVQGSAHFPTFGKVRAAIREAVKPEVRLKRTYHPSRPPSIPASRVLAEQKHDQKREQFPTLSEALHAFVAEVILARGVQGMWPEANRGEVFRFANRLAKLLKKEEERMGTEKPWLVEGQLSDEQLFDENTQIDQLGRRGLQGVIASFTQNQAKAIEHLSMLLPAAIAMRAEEKGVPQIEDEERRRLERTYKTEKLKKSAAMVVEDLLFEFEKELGKLPGPTPWEILRKSL